MENVRRKRLRFVELAALSGCVAAVLIAASCAIVLARERSARQRCGACITGIAKALNLYAAECADSLPIVEEPKVPGRYSNQPAGTLVARPGAQDAVESYYDQVHPTRMGQPTVCLWILVLKGNVGPKQFICGSDPSHPQPCPQTDDTGRFYDDFGGNGVANCLSYSFAYPWTAAGGAAGYWRSTVDSTIPLITDMAPLSGTAGKNTAAPRGAANARVYNSENHGGEGQNVAYADTHVEWHTDPYAGQAGDNMWTIGPDDKQTAITKLGVTPGTASTSTPFDIIMVPVRDAATGKL
jgi:hypothetical protein